MAGERSLELLAGVKKFYRAIDENDDAHDAAEVCVVQFNTGAELTQDFANIDNLKQDITFDPTGLTFMGEGINLSLDTLEKRKSMYSNRGVLYYQPWLVLMTDGQPNGNSAELDRAVERVVKMVTDKKLTVFPIGIGYEADMSVLQRFSPNRPPLRLQGLKFAEFFQWLSNSVARVSQSTPGDTVPLDLEGLAGWAEL